MNALSQILNAFFRIKDPVFQNLSAFACNIIEQNLNAMEALREKRKRNFGEELEARLQSMLPAEEKPRPN